MDDARERVGHPRVSVTLQEKARQGRAPGSTLTSLAARKSNILLLNCDTLATSGDMKLTDGVQVYETRDLHCDLWVWSQDVPYPYFPQSHAPKPS